MTKEAKPRKLKAGATRRLEFHTKWFICFTRVLRPAQVGELMEMLMAEVLDEPVQASADRRVQDTFDKRREYSRIRGSFGRKAAKPLSAWQS